MSRELKEKKIYIHGEHGWTRMSASGLFLGEQQFTSIGQQLKEIGPQADGGGEHELSRNDHELKEISPQADGGI